MRTTPLLGQLILFMTGGAVAGSGPLPAPKDACTLLTPAEVQALAKEKIGPGVSTTVSSQLNSYACEYTWGKGGNAVTGRYGLHVTITDQSKAFPGLDPGSVKQGLLASAESDKNPGTVIPGVGDFAMYQSNAPIRAETTALAKGWMLQLGLEGPDAATRKDQVISLLKAAAGRL